MAEPTAVDIPYRTLGRTGERVSAIGIGGWHLGLKPVTEKIAVEIVRQAIDRGTVTAIECLHYALSLPTSVVITGIDSLERLDQAIEAVRTFRRMSDAERKALLAKTARAASFGEFEPFKTTSIFDGTATRPDWLGEEPQRFQELMPE